MVYCLLRLDTICKYVVIQASFSWHAGGDFRLCLVGGGNINKVTVVKPDGSEETVPIPDPGGKSVIH